MVRAGVGQRPLQRVTLKALWLTRLTDVSLHLLQERAVCDVTCDAPTCAGAVTGTAPAAGSPRLTSSPCSSATCDAGARDRPLDPSKAAEAGRTAAQMQTSHQRLLLCFALTQLCPCRVGSKQDIVPGTESRPVPTSVISLPSPTVPLIYRWVVGSSLSD
jgi:hypothetical protein